MDYVNAAGLNRCLPSLTDKQKNSIRKGKYIQVCEEKRDGWSGSLPFYIFFCPDCEDFSYDYMHGYPENRHLNCHRCRAHIDCSPWWVELAGLVALIRFGVAGKFGGSR